MYKVTFAFEDGTKTETFANEGDNLLDIARESNVAIDAPVFRKCILWKVPCAADRRRTGFQTDHAYQR